LGALASALPLRVAAGRAASGVDFGLRKAAIVPLLAGLATGALAVEGEPDMNTFPRVR
jgi:hypothetical protein